MSTMLPNEVYNLLRVPAPLSAEASLRKAWLSAQSRPCKDVIALALPLRRVPTTLEAFKHSLAENSKGSDWIISTWYVVYVGAADGREWGWSNAPYDTKKRLPDAKALYGTDTEGALVGQTRFWSFKKVSNNMNKGPRVEAADGEDLSFVLPAGTCFTHFIREDSYGEKPLFFGGEALHELLPYAPVLLQLSSTNHEQAEKGNGLKLRRVLPLPANALSAFCDKFHALKLDLDDAQQRAAGFKALSSTAKPAMACPLAFKLDRNAFWFHDEAAHTIEVLESGVDPELGCKLLISEDLLLRAVHSADLQRALSMLTIAIGHAAVTCVVAANKDDAAGTCRVVHLHVDVPETLWLGALQKSRNADSPELPCTSALTMCFGKALGGADAGAGARGGDTLSHLQWYAPSCKVPMATEDGRDVLRHVVFEMEPELQSVEGQRQLPQKTVLMDSVAGSHYIVKILLAESVEFDPLVGLRCEKLEPLLSWQLRPGLGVDVGGMLHTTRKRQCVHADANDTDLLAGKAKKVRFADEDADESQRI